jgi:hypothetical protein
LGRSKTIKAMEDKKAEENKKKEKAAAIKKLELRKKN